MSEQTALYLVGIVSLLGLIGVAIWVMWRRYKSGYFYRWNAIGWNPPPEKRIYRDKNPKQFWLTFCLVTAMASYFYFIGLTMVYHLVLNLIGTP
jgi:hypothetical protein